MGVTLPLQSDYVEPQQWLGAFAAGSVPPSLEHTFKDADGGAVDLSGGTLAVLIEATAGVTATLGTGTLSFKDTDPTLGTVIYNWGADDMRDPGYYRLQLWVTIGSSKLDSDVFTYVVYDGPGTPP